MQNVIEISEDKIKKEFNTIKQGNDFYSFYDKILSLF